MLEFLRKLDPIVHLFFLISVIVLSTLVFLMRRQIANLNLQLATKKTIGTEVADRDLLQPTTEVSTQFDPEDIKTIVSDLIATISATPQKIVEQVVRDEDGKSSSYIPLGATASTTSTGWQDVDDAQVYVDVDNDYGKDSYITWEASLKVAHGNGQAYARLFDDTNKIAVLGSELSTTNNSDFKQASSGKLNFWSGNNLYKVQIKSLNSFEVTYSAGRIKIAY